MIRVENIETATRTIEAFNALSVILPIYDDEARSVFRATFQIDMADLLPEFFRSLALLAIRNKDEFDLYLNYFTELLRYIKHERDNLPKPKNFDDRYFTELRDSAEKLLKSWMVKSCIVDEK